MLALILILILIAVTIFTALLESFYTPEDLSQMGIHLGYSLTGRSAGRRPANPEPCQENGSRTQSVG
jgi:hypothetical protein